MNHLFKTISLVITLLLNCLLTYGQTGSISGSVKDQQNAGVPFATITLFVQADSNQLKGGFTDEKGAFHMKEVPYGRYFLKITNVGYKTITTPAFDIAAGKDYNTGELKFEQISTMLKGLEVKSRKPVLEKKADRFVMNVTASSYQTNDLGSIFRAMPFMDVDADGAVKINGKSNVMILVDNVPRPKESLETIFASMTGQDIEKIEFITNPSAQYDGDADAVINIITKKGQLRGFTGSVIGGVSQGVYANGNAGLSFTLREKRIVLNGNLSAKGGDYYIENYGYRILNRQTQPLVLKETPWDLNKTVTLSGLLGLEYALSPNHTIMVQVDDNHRRQLDGSRWHNTIAFSNALDGRSDSVLLGLQRAHSRTTVTNYSLSYKGKLDSLGKRISATVIFTPVERLLANEMQYQNVVDADGKILTKRPVIRNTNPGKSSIWVGQVDAQLPFANAWEVDGGAKVSISALKSYPYQEELTADQNWAVIPEFTFSNVYRERILAAYAGLQKSFGKFSFNAAVRGEKTKMKVEGAYERNFTDLFPSLLLRQEFSKDYYMAFNYKRSINRPSFIQLTSYRSYLDDYTVLEGNPSLKPQYADQLNLNTGIKNKIFIDLDYVQNKNSFTQLPIQQGDTTVWKVINLNDKYYMATLSYDYHFTSWWTGSAFIRGSYYETNGLLGGEEIRSSGLSMLLGLAGTFSLPGDLKLDFTFNYRSPRPYGLAVAREKTFARLGLKGNFAQKRIQYTIFIADIFKDDIFGFNLKASNLQSRFYTFSDSRRLGIGLVYNFGKSTVKAAQNKKLENEELLNRTN